MLDILILSSTYIFSILGARWGFRRFSSKHLNLWLDEDCQISIVWFVPFINTLLCIVMSIDIMNHYLKIKAKNLKLKLPKSK